MTRSARALVVHESMFGNTETVARAIAEELTRRGVPTDARPVAEAPAAADLTVDLLVLGAPTHAFSLSRHSTRQDAADQGGRQTSVDVGLREWLEEARRDRRTPRLRTVTYDTRVTRVRRLPGSAARAAQRLARRAGLAPAGPAESFYVEDVTGPLAAGELERARAWAVTRCTEAGLLPAAAANSADIRPAGHREGDS